MGSVTDTYGWLSAEPCHTEGYVTPAVRRTLKAYGAGDVLDAGCGNGALCARLAEDGVRIIGIDADRQGVAIARDAHPDIRFEVMTFDQSPLSLKATEDGRFDCVVSTEVIEHLYSPHELARFSFEALRPGGLFVVSTPYHGYLKNLVLSLLNKWDTHHTALWHGGHIKFWSIRTLSELLSRYNFKVERVFGVGRLPFLWKSMILVARKPQDLE